MEVYSWEHPLNRRFSGKPCLTTAEGKTTQKHGEPQLIDVNWWVHDGHDGALCQVQWLLLGSCGSRFSMNFEGSCWQARGGNQDVWVKSGRSLKHLKATWIPYSKWNSLLVGGLEHLLFSPIVGMMMQPDYIIYFSEGLKPPTSLCWIQKLDSAGPTPRWFAPKCKVYYSLTCPKRIILIHTGCTAVEAKNNRSRRYYVWFSWPWMHHDYRHLQILLRESVVTGPK